MAKAKNFIPEGHTTITPHFVIKDAAKAVEFYKKAFNAEEIGVMKMPDGMVCHAEMRIGNGMFYFCEEMDCGDGIPTAKAPGTLKGSTFVMHLYVPDADKVYSQAVTAGCKGLRPMEDQFWGDRYGGVVDPFGVYWSFATHKEDLTPAEISQRMAKFCSEMEGKH